MLAKFQALKAFLTTAKGKSIAGTIIVLIIGVVLWKKYKKPAHLKNYKR
jgi:hypothetical protein